MDVLPLTGASAARCNRPQKVGGALNPYCFSPLIVSMLFIEILLTISSG